MHRGLSGVEANQLLNREMSQLATDLATNTTGGSRDKHGLPFQQIADLIQINMDLLTTQQIPRYGSHGPNASPHLHVAPPSPGLPMSSRRPARNNGSNGHAPDGQPLYSGRERHPSCCEGSSDTDPPRSRSGRPVNSAIRMLFLGIAKGKEAHDAIILHEYLTVRRCGDHHALLLRAKGPVPACVSCRVAEGRCYRH